MIQEQQKQFNKFKEFAGWMYGDSELALYLAQAQFLVALGLFNYIETLGAFYIGYFQKDSSGNIKPHIRKGVTCTGCSQCINGQLKTASVERFKKFFSYMGNEYKNLSNAHPEMYKELRCGLSHEFLPSERPFKIYHAGSNTFSKEQINNESHFIDSCVDNLTNDLDNSIVNCGVVLLKYNGQEIWQVFVPKLAADFRRSVQRFISEIISNLALHKNFFETASQINLEHF
ncbi:MAG: hypothetical protein Q7S82_03240 [bacterium]|nr:hypothetical protein [bacterium]